MCGLGFGVEVEHHEDSIPKLKTPVVHTLQDIGRLRVPGWMIVLIRGTSISCTIW
jgi:hypothetical protein